MRYPTHTAATAPATCDAFSRSAPAAAARWAGSTFRPMARRFRYGSLCPNMDRAMKSERRARVRLEVFEADTAITLRSGDVPVLATPRVVALCEEAAYAALADMLEPDRTSVGTWIELEHLAPSPIGAEVVAEATLTRADGRRLQFA
jgi:predicted thioesterase